MRERLIGVASCFNGAAPRGARNSARSGKAWRCYMVLQRGRAPGGAELCSRKADGPMTNVWLQRGRAPGGAELPRKPRVE